MQLGIRNYELGITGLKWGKSFLLFLFLLIVYFIGCKGADKTPPGILSQAKMIPLITDLHIADAAVSVRNLPPDSARKCLFVYYHTVYRKHKTDEEQLKKSLDYYAGKPIQLEHIYEEVLNELSRKEGEAGNN